MKNVKIVICGLGTVGKEFVSLLADRRRDVERRYDIRFDIAAAVDIGGAALASDGDGLPPDELITYLREGAAIESFSDCGRPGMTGKEALEAAGGDMLVEMTPTNLDDGEPGTTHIMTALERGMDVVSANKGPLVLFYREISETARRHHCGVHMSAATAAALPTLDVGTVSLAGASIRSIEGILNGTTNYILSRMTDDGCRYDEALREAQKLGIAETHPGYDVEGTDTANKIILIANRLLDGSFTKSDVAVTGITGITVGDIDQARHEGRTIKLIGSAHRANGTMKLAVAPRSLDRGHPLASVNGPEKAVTYTTDTMGDITVLGGKSSPLGAAAAVLKDMINACMKKDSPGSRG